MSLTKEIVIDRVEVLENGTVQVRQATRIKEGDVQLSQAFHRWVIAPGQDYSDQEYNVKAICELTHTPEVVAAYQSQIQPKNLG